MSSLPFVFPIDRRVLARFDWVVFCCSLAIALLGIINLYSAGLSTDSTSLLFQRQAYWLFIGIIFLLAASFVNLAYFERYAYVFYLFALILLALVLIQGKLVSGSKRWLYLGFFNLQPSELAKISLAIVLAKYFQRKHQPQGFGLSALFVPSLLVVLPFLLVFLQPDLGTALTLLLIFLSIVLFVRIRLRLLSFFVFFSICLLPFSWNLLKDYQKDRIIGFLNPHMDPLGKGYQIIQSKIAIGSGRLFGKGLLKGTQTQLDFIPEKYTDFVFSVFCEEWGLLGALILLSLYFILLIRSITIISQARSSFSLLLGYGIVALFLWQIMINLGMVLGLLPTVGIPLPLFSYGGSSLVVSFFSLGILINIHIQKHIF
jgi:rod shape determining protein RodA